MSATATWSLTSLGLGTKANEGKSLRENGLRKALTLIRGVVIAKY